jgi:hypothetical protein
MINKSLPLHKSCCGWHSLYGDFNSRTAKYPDFIYIENNNDNIDFFELSDVNSVNILESLNIPVGRINKDSVKNHYGSRLLDLCLKSPFRNIYL